MFVLLLKISNFYPTLPIYLCKKDSTQHVISAIMNHKAVLEFMYTSFKFLSL